MLSGIMKPYLVDPQWKPLTVAGAAVDMTQLGATELIVDPLELAYPLCQDACSAIELRGVMVGDDSGLAVDATLKAYRCPDANADLRDIAAYDSDTVAYSGGTAIGLDKVTNGAFAADTDWEKGNAWTIAAGVATHAATGSKSAIQQDVVVVAGTWYLLRLDITTLSVAPLDVFIGNQLIKSFTATGAKQAGLVKRAALGEDKLKLIAPAGSNAVLDNVKLEIVVPYRFSDVRQALGQDDNAGSGIAYGILPGADLADNYISLHARRYLL
ncbi:MAG: hypothetical protein ACYTAN_12755 [Planctomycetota bacterium]|jgi:hypothetical protein